MTLKLKDKMLEGDLYLERAMTIFQGKKRWTFDFSFIILRGGSKKIHCCDLWQSVVPVFSSKSFIMSVLMFRS